MPAAARFLYGVALGLSLGIIGVRLLSSASSGPQRGQGRRPHTHTLAEPPGKPKRRERVAS